MHCAVSLNTIFKLVPERGPCTELVGPLGSGPWAMFAEQGHLPLTLRSVGLGQVLTGPQLPALWMTREAGPAGLGWGLRGHPALAEAQRGSVLFGWGHGGGFATRPPTSASQMGPQVC